MRRRAVIGGLLRAARGSRGSEAGPATTYSRRPRPAHDPRAIHGDRSSHGDNNGPSGRCRLSQRLVEDIKSSWFVRQILERNGQTDAAVAPPG